MDKGDQTPPVQRRKERKADVVAERVKAHVDVPLVAAGVQPLNPGFFQSQRMRAAGAKRKGGERKVRQQ